MVSHCWRSNIRRGAPTREHRAFFGYSIEVWCWMTEGTASWIGAGPGSSLRWRRGGSRARNSASSRRVSFSKLYWRFFTGGSASGSRVSAGGSPFHSGAGRRAGLGAGRRMMLGSITSSFRPPTITRCSDLTGKRRPGNAHESFSGNSMSAYRILGPGAEPVSRMTSVSTP